MNFLTNVEVTEIFSFRLVSEGNAGSEIPDPLSLEFVEKLSVSIFALLDAEDNTSGTLNRGGKADLPFLRALLVIRQNLREPIFWEVIDSCCISISKFGSFQNLFSVFTSLFELHFRCRRFILLVKTKEVFSMSYDSNPNI